MEAFKIASNANFHLVYRLALITRYRRKRLSEAMLNEIKDLAEEVLIRWGCELKEFSGGAEHVLMRFEATPSVTPARLVNRLKTATSRELRRRYGGERGLWALSYAISSAEGAGEDSLRRYIERGRGGGRQR